MWTNYWWFLTLTLLFFNLWKPFATFNFSVMQITLISRIIQRNDYWISRSDVSKMILPLNCVCVACICGNKFFQLECRQARNVWQVAFKWHLSFWSPLFPIILKASYSLLLSLVSSSSLLCFLLSCLFFLFSVVPLHFI